jgi:sphingolipid 4-desaturase/C4-monooxygenase
MIEKPESLGAADGAPHFVYSETPQPHVARAREILRAHPEVRAFSGRNPWSGVLIVALVSLQTALAWLLRGQPVWVILLAAWFVGAFVSHALWVLIHDATHNLVVKSRSWNRVFAMIANFPHLFPSAISFQKYHAKHHAFLGVYEMDADVPNEWEARLVGNSAPAKALWLFLFPFFQLTRPPRLKQIAFFDGWVLVNIVVQVAYDAAVIFLLGPKALLFLLGAFFFSIGLHPVGARWIQEHYLVHGTNQETSSYYGILNVTALNIGYHNEHHDFPWVPWNRLPDVRRTAPEFYDTLAFHRSWTRLLLTFIFDPKISLWSRVVRRERAGVPVAADATVNEPATA